MGEMSCVSGARGPLDIDETSGGHIKNNDTVLKCGT